MSQFARFPPTQDAAWEQSFIEQAKLIRFGDQVTYQEGAEDLRTLVKSGVLRFRDIQENPARFFAAHRLLLAPGVRGPGFGIRFTVQFNLFCGSIMGLGSPEQVAMLDEMQTNGTLGCFGLTEKLAGVNSGLVVNTTATWVPETQMFCIDSGSVDGEKNWISQGLTADKCVVFANLIINGKKHGPHGFVVDMRATQGGDLLPGITVSDMGKKTTGNDLDNAAIRFDKLMVAKSSLLSKFADIQDNKYVQTTKERMRLEVIGQRLLTGRLCIAQASIAFAARLFERTKDYSDQKRCWSPVGEPVLSSMPQLNDIYEKATVDFQRMVTFTSEIEKRLTKCLVENTIPDADLVEAIGVSKIKCVEAAIEYSFRLKQEVGSYALMYDTGFEHLDFLQCCKFAEGDSRILLQKMARDRLRKFQGSGWMDVAQSVVLSPAISRREIMLCFELAQALARGQSNPGQAWNDSWEKVYELGHTVCERHIELVESELAQQAPQSKL